MSVLQSILQFIYEIFKMRSEKRGCSIIIGRESQRSLSFSMHDFQQGFPADSNNLFLSIVILHLKFLAFQINFSVSHFPVISRAISGALLSRER